MILQKKNLWSDLDFRYTILKIFHTHTIAREPEHEMVNFNRRNTMIANLNTLRRAGVLVVAMLSFSAWSGAQTPAPAPKTENPPAATTDKDKTPASKSMTLDDPNAPPANPEEDAAFKAFVDTPSPDQTKRIELGEAFLQKYPTSRYRPGVYSALTMAYLQTNNVQKMEEVADKEIALNPNDVQVMAVVGQTLPRAMNSKTTDPERQLAKAEQYDRKVIEITPTLPKPPNVTDESFASVKNQTLAMAHGGLGLVYVRRGKFSEAIPELNQAVTIDPTPDPVNFYLLGMANVKASHFEDAVTAYNKCAALIGAMQETCKNGAVEAKKLAGTQLSAPK
jgi:tetratricopeptide (TPR) repeat protein